MSLDALLEIELIEMSKAQRNGPMSYDWHVKAYSVYLLRQRGVWLDWSDFDKPSRWTDKQWSDFDGN